MSQEVSQFIGENFIILTALFTTLLAFMIPTKYLLDFRAYTISPSYLDFFYSIVPELCSRVFFNNLDSWTAIIAIRKAQKKAKGFPCLSAATAVSPAIDGEERNQFRFIA